MREQRPRTLYLTRNGLLEPLGQSQVMAYLRGLSHDYAITLITHEKDEDRLDSARMQAARIECERLGIRWLPQRFNPKPKLVAPAFGMLRMLWLVRREVRRDGIRLIHCRSYVPSTVGMLVSRLTGVPFIFDMRALWPEELITAGRLSRGSWLHRRIVAAERACLRGAAGVVSLTHAAVDHLRRTYPDELRSQRLVVIPTCADLDRFIPAPAPEGRVIGCLGTMLSGWFRIDWLRALLLAAAAREPGLQIELTTRDDADRLRSALGPNLAARITIAAARPEEIPAILQRQFASVMFYAGGEVSELGRSPTRMGEILGCGRPVVANEGVGDVARIIRDHRVGVIVRGPDAASMAEALAELDLLLTDPDLARRCRQAAEEVFSLAAGTESYLKLYYDILSSRHQTGAA